MKKIDLLGRRFGRLTVISEAAKIKKRIRWLCLCDCGKTKIIDGSNLRNGYTRSCGCLHSEVIKAANSTHKQAKTRLYHIWMNMKARCLNPKNKSWNRYGGRGIKVCGEWLEDFERFSRWAKTNGYSEELSIDRIDVNGNYEPNNCRWATPQKQARNTRKNVFYKGRCLAEWCHELGISPTTVDRRLHRSHWPIEKALFTPVFRKF